MRTVSLGLGSGVNYALAEKAAREAAMEAGGKLTLVAWYDKVRNMEGPREACANEGWKCARVYADHHGADIGVLVNEDQYEFYFTRIPEGFEELDEEAALDIHESAKRPDFDNVQGG
ncbi:MAG: hypothetical protein C4532_10990 [Candidatus Abyssobacteria bacterium SURF_17]|jgi:hypothetical protein|uniref:DUF5619 domain-containing protein n=1 Tax=Candidatus Abyssobacteria bacterium SURF_17 TaxID=2093361 RepID=A0A419EXE8_9BACT|nr:MAG: hypothetical protein C4532_10990 [Candidatus Abyssubacteria bacterium SURF_17]